MQPSPPSDSPGKTPCVGLLVTCLADLFRPSVGFASVKLLEQAGCRVDVPELQTCCGQPAYNSGDAKHARSVARRVIEAFEPYDYVVVPSGSCGGMVRAHYVDLFKDDAEWLPRARQIARKTYELMGFLVDIMGMTQVDAHYTGTATYHDACSGLRELGVKIQPRRLLHSVQGLQLSEMEATEVCCGFGGTFCVKYPEISAHMAGDKAQNARQTGADTLLAGDLGCLMNIAGRMRRLGIDMRCYHIAEVLADMAGETAPIGQAPKRS